jgi:hypothetical protein
MYTFLFFPLSLCLARSAFFYFLGTPPRRSASRNATSTTHRDALRPHGVPTLCVGTITSLSPHVKIQTSEVSKTSEVSSPRVKYSNALGSDGKDCTDPGWIRMQSV